MIVQMTGAGKHVDLPAQVAAGPRSPFNGDAVSDHRMLDRERGHDRVRVRAITSKGGG